MGGQGEVAPNVAGRAKRAPLGGVRAHLPRIFWYFILPEINSGTFKNQLNSQFLGGASFWLGGANAPLCPPLNETLDFSL